MSCKNCKDDYRSRPMKPDCKNNQVVIWNRERYSWDVYFVPSPTDKVACPSLRLLSRVFYDHTETFDNTPAQPALISEKY